MATSKQRRVAEERMRELLEGADLPAPDHVEQRDDEIALFWCDQKVVVEIDLRDAPLAERMGRGGLEPPHDGL